MKHLLAVGVLLCAGADDALAQGVEIHTRYGPSGTHIPLSASTQTFNYEATISSSSAPFEIKLEVYHNGVLKFTDSELVAFPVTSYAYSCGVDMSGWGLTEGDLVTFVCKVIDTATGATLATHCLYGDVTGT